MIRIAARNLSRTGRIFPVAPPQSVRLFSSNDNQFNPNPVALQMINYALSLARSQKSDESYGQGLLVLEQCEVNQPDDDSKGLVLLAMSSLLSERGNLGEAIEKLSSIKDLNISSMALRVAASEALVGLHLELGQDDTSSVLADLCLQDLDAVKLERGLDFGTLDARTWALKGLVELVRGNPESADSYFKAAQDNIGSVGNAALSYAEYLHAMRNFSCSKQLYQKVIHVLDVPRNNYFSDPNDLAAGNMTWEDVLLAATCALGQLEAHMGNFADAEDILTRALSKTEEHFGSHHPNVGVILTCIALMFRHKAEKEHSSSFLIQEGLYRRAIDLLKAPPLEVEGEFKAIVFDVTVGEAKVSRRDIVALARGGYAETLLVQQNRKAEGEQMKRWAETAWKNRRLSLAEALEVSESSSKVLVLDARISRAV